MGEKSFINWKSYYQDSQVDEYNLRNTKHVRLFNTNDLNMPGDYQVNYLNQYLGELPMMWYIWKNNLKSDYICISQYRRDITNIDFDRLDNDEIQFIYWKTSTIKPKDALFKQDFIDLGENVVLDHDPDGFFKENIYKYLKMFFGKSDVEINNLMNSSNHDEISAFVFACNWKMYCKICEFIFGFLDMLFPNNKWKDINELVKFKNKRYNIYKTYYKELDGWHIYMDNRYIVFIVEMVCRICLPLLYKTFLSNKLELDTNILTIIPKDIYSDLNTVAHFYKKNLKVNPNTIYVVCEDKDKYNEYYDFFITKYHWQFNKIKILKSINQLDNINNLFKIKYDEYADVDEPIDFKKNKYIIRKFNELHHLDNLS